LACPQAEARKQGRMVRKTANTPTRYFFIAVTPGY
jgi:hypothetical protein